VVLGFSATSRGFGHGLEAVRIRVKEFVSIRVVDLDPNNFEEILF
jgi:hypothetical protein